MCMAFSKYGRVKLGGLEKPEISTAKWLAIIMSTLLAGGGVLGSSRANVSFDDGATNT